jgi:hypothetical protein
VRQMDLSQAVWRKSTYSSGSGQCVEVAFLSNAVAVRDSKNRSGPVLVFTPREWAAFVGGVLDAEFERP